MVILDFPYVSEYLQDCLVKADIPVIHTPVIEKLGLREDVKLISENQAIEAFKDNPENSLYSNSENAINWIGHNLSFTNIPDKIDLCKDKVKFRDLTRSLYPDYYYEELQVDDFSSFAEKKLPYPLILKPAVGFFSMGVYRLDGPQYWMPVQKRINEEISKTGHLYPIEVFDSSRFILEACIPGREFAIDAYFDLDGKAVIMNISEHFFSSDEDMGDRLYQIQSRTFREFYDVFQMQIQSMGQLAELRNFPVHVEVRVTPDNLVVPVEINPLRFGGWCTTGDLAGLSFGINPYQMFLNKEKPDWDKIFSTREDKAYNLLILDNVTGIDGQDIKGFDFDKLSARFRNVLEVRKIDHVKYPVFGFLFIETNKDEEELLAEMLRSDLREYIITL